MLTKQPLPTECFESAFLELLRMRFDCEPLPHYVMAAMHVCHATNRDYPDFVRGFFTWFADSFLFETEGRFPTQGHNANPSDARWRRYKDCHDLLQGWLNDDLEDALNWQEAELVRVEDVEYKRSEERSDGTASGRKQASTKKPEGLIFSEIAEEKGVSADHVRRSYKRQVEPKEFMSHNVPIALVRCENGFTIETRQVGKPGEIRYKAGKKLRP